MAISEDFSGTLAKWTERSGTGWSIVTGELLPPTANGTGGMNALIYSDESSGGPINWAKVVLPWAEGGGPGYGVILRCDNAASITGYQVLAYKSATTTINPIVSGSYATTELTTTDVAWFNGDVIGASIEGFDPEIAIKIWRNPVGADPSAWGLPDISHTVTGTQIDTGNYVGIGMFFGANGSTRLDDFAGGVQGSVALSVDAGAVTLTGGDASLSATGGLSEVPSTWFNGQWWKVPTFGSASEWWELAGNVTLSAELGTITLTGGDAVLFDTTGDVTLDVDLGTITLTGGDALLTSQIVTITADAGVVTLIGGDATLDIEFSGDAFTLSTSGTFDGKGIRFDTDVAFNTSNGITAGIGYGIVKRLDTDTMLLDGIFGDPPQNYQIVEKVAETTVPASMTFEFNGTSWVLIGKANLGL